MNLESEEKYNVESIARICHEANRAYCVGIGDHSHASWDDCPDWQKATTCEGVKAVLLDPYQTASYNHWLWMEHKKKSGWTYGEKKDPVRKTHPGMVLFEHLSEQERTKNHIFIALCRVFGFAVGTKNEI